MHAPSVLCRPVATPPTFAQMQTRTPEESNPSALPVQPHARARESEHASVDTLVLVVVSLQFTALHLVSRLHNARDARTTPLCLSGEPLML
jgi:hypothetical protein